MCCVVGLATVVVSQARQPPPPSPKTAGPELGGSTLNGGKQGSRLVALTTCGDGEDSRADGLSSVIGMECW